MTDSPLLFKYLKKGDKFKFALHGSAAIYVKVNATTMKHVRAGIEDPANPEREVIKLG